MDTYFVYLHLNKINKKRYYGITAEQTPEIRWKKGYSHNKHFFAAINKYGWDNFEHIVLYSNLNKQQAEEREAYLIALYETTNPEKGYNLTSGGGLGVTKHNEESKKLMSIHSSGKLNPMYGKHHSKETKEKIKQALQSHPNTSKKVLCVETNIIYNSTREAERKTGINHSCINQAALPNGKKKTAGKYHWKYIEDTNNE